MNRRDGERERLRHSLAQLRAAADSIDIAMRYGGPLGTEIAQTLTLTAIAAAMQIAKHDAFVLAESDTPFTPQEKKR